MPDQLHLVERLIKGHRCGHVQLLPHQHRTGVARLRCKSRWPQSAAVAASRRIGGRSICAVGALAQLLRRGGHRNGSPGASMHLATVCCFAQPGLKLGPCEIEGLEHLVRRSLGADHRTRRNAGQLDPLADLCHPWIALARDLDIDSLSLRRQLRDLGELVLARVCGAEPGRRYAGR